MGILADRLMTSEKTRRLFRPLGVPAISALAIILVAAGVDLDRNRARLEGLPKAQRLELIESLRRFDLVLKTDQRKADRCRDHVVHIWSCFGVVEPCHHIQAFRI